jgi:hypothetical protein
MEQAQVAAMVKRDLQEKRLKIRGAYDMMLNLSLSLYSLTLARWMNPTLYDMAWKIIRLSLTDERTSSGALDEDSYQALSSVSYEDPLPPLPPSPFLLDESPDESLKND